MALKVTVGGAKTGVGAGVSVAGGVTVDVGGAGVKVTVGRSVSVTVGMVLGMSVSAAGPKGVGEGEAFGLGVTVGPMTVGIDGPGPVQADKSKGKISRKNRRTVIFIATLLFTKMGVTILYAGGLIPRLTAKAV